jgi:hypothetical protein
MSTTSTYFGPAEAQAARSLIGGTALGDNRNDLLKQILVAMANKASGLPSGSTITDIINQITDPAEYSVGYLGIPQNSQSADYTLVLTDSGKHIYHPGADTTPRTWTIPANASVAFPIGSAVTFVNDTSAGAITIAITSDTLVLAGDGTTGSRTLAANGIATAIKITSTRWMISGTGLT